MNQQEVESLKKAFEALPHAFQTEDGTDVKLVSYSLLETIVDQFGQIRYTEGVMKGSKTSAAIITQAMESVFGNKAEKTVSVS
jgi:hypothetical protein